MFTDRMCLNICEKHSCRYLFDFCIFLYDLWFVYFHLEGHPQSFNQKSETVEMHVYMENLCNILFYLMLFKEFTLYSVYLADYLSKCIQIAKQ